MSLNPQLLHYLNSLSTGLLKSYTFSPTFSAQEKNFNKNLSSAKVIVERVFTMLKGRRRGFLAMLVSSRENVSNTIIMCFVLHNFS